MSCKMFVLTFSLLLATALPVAAATITWDADTGTAGAQDGVGNWITGGNNWSDGNQKSWANGDYAVVGAGTPAYTAAPLVITVDPAGVSLSGLTFSPVDPLSDGTYRITGGALNFTGVAPTITLNQYRDLTAPNAGGDRTRIESPLSGSNLTFNSDIVSPVANGDCGWVFINGTNTNTGTLTVNNNAIVSLDTAGALSAGVTGVTLNSGGSMYMNFAGTISVPLTLGSMGPVLGNGTSGVVPTNANWLTLGNTTNGFGMRFGTTDGTTNVDAPITLTGDSIIAANNAVGGIVNLNATGGPINAPNYHLSLKANYTGTLNLNRAVDVASLGLQLSQNGAGKFGTMTINAPVTAHDLFIYTAKGCVLTVNSPITLSATGSYLGKMFIRSAGGSASGNPRTILNATLTAPGGIELSSQSNLQLDIELNNPTGLALNTPEILFTTEGVTAATGDSLVALKRNDQISPNVLLHYNGTGNAANRIFRLEGHTQTVGGIQTTDMTAPTQAVIENGLASTTGTLTIDNASDYTFGGNFQNGAGTNSRLKVVKRGAGKLTLSGSSLHTGGMVVEAGTLDISAATLNANYDLTVNGGTVDFVDSSPIVNKFTITGGTAIGSGYLSTSVNYDVQGGDVYVNLSGTMGLNKTGAGTATLHGLLYYTDKTTIAGGTLKISSNGLISSSGIDFQNNAILDVTALTNIDLSYKTLQGYGTIAGNVATTNATLNLNLAPTLAGVSDKISILGNLDIGTSSSFTLNLGALGSSVQTGVAYPVITYSGTLTGGSPNFYVSDKTRYDFIAALNTGSKQITVTASGGPAKNLSWTATASPSSWDLMASYNWNSGTDQFYDLDTVSFGDGAAGIVDVYAAMLPGAITVNSTQDYEFMGLGSIGGGPTFTKSGTGTLTISMANTFSSDLTVNAGTLKINNAAALGTTAGKTILNNNAVLDTNSFGLGAEEVVVGGSGGVKIGNFAVANTTQTISRLTLNANVTIGGGTPGAPGPNSSEYRLDIRDSDGTGFLNGNGKKLTKIDANRLYLVNLGETHLGDVDLQAGYTGLIGDTTLGDQPGTVSVASGANLQFYASTVDQTKDFNLADTAILLVSNATLTGKISGDVTLGGAVTAQIDDGSTFTLSGDVMGTGSLTLVDYTGVVGGTGGTLVLDGAKSYTGPTNVNVGVLHLTGSGAMASSLITVGTTLDVLDGNHAVNNIAGTGVVKVQAGASLTAASINVDTLTIGAPATAAAVPEPATWTLLLIGLLAAMVLRQYQNR